MTVVELIRRLLDPDIPMDAEVEFVYDGSARATVECAWKPKKGKRVLLADLGAPLYHKEDWRKGAKPEKGSNIWFADGVS